MARGGGVVAHMGAKGNASWVFWATPKERDHLEDLGIDEIILKLGVAWEAWTGFIWLRMDTNGELL